jgi:hypothetical protein
MWIWITVIGLILAVAITSSILNHPKVRGIIGEKRVRKQLARLPQEDYRVLNDVMVKSKKGTSQIDHVILSQHGIFVIETKNYRGWIHGDDNSEYWTQTFYRTKIRFHNPVRQNWGHTCALKETLPEYEKVPYHSIVVFAGKAKLMNVNTKTDVIYPDQLLETIMSHKGPRQLSSGDMEKITNFLQQSSVKDKKLKTQHVKRIKWNVKVKDMKSKALLCPKCEGKMVKRSGQYGEFYGCSNHTQCKYTARLNRD